MKVHKCAGPKLGNIGKRAILVGYTPSGFILLKPEEGKFYESRDVRFNEKLIYGDKYRKQSIKDWIFSANEINKEKWFVEFERETNENSSETLKLEGEIKKKRGRPKKDSEGTTFKKIMRDAEQITNEEQRESKNTATPHTTSGIDDTSYHALLAKSSSDPASYREAMLTKEKSKWQKAINEELMSMKEKKSFDISRQMRIDK